MKQEVILIGGGGHCKSVIDVIEDQNIYNIVGILDVPKKIGEEVMGYKIIGSDIDLESLTQKNYLFHITVGFIKSNQIRVKLFNLLKLYNANILTIIAKDAYVSKHVKINEGCFIGHKAVINAGVLIKENTIINTGAIVEHDSKIGAHCHISTMATINGDCEIGNHCFLSSHVVMNLGCKIADHTTVYSGTIITKSFSQPGSSLKGIPAKINS